MNDPIEATEGLLEVALSDLAYADNRIAELEVQYQEMYDINRANATARLAAEAKLARVREWWDRHGEGDELDHILKDTRKPLAVVTDYAQMLIPCSPMPEVQKAWVKNKRLTFVIYECDKEDR